MRLVFFFRPSRSARNETAARVASITRCLPATRPPSPFASVLLSARLIFLFPFFSCFAFFFERARVKTLLPRSQRRKVLRPPRYRNFPNFPLRAFQRTNVRTLRLAFRRLDGAPLFFSPFLLFPFKVHARRLSSFLTGNIARVCFDRFEHNCGIIFSFSYLDSSNTFWNVCKNNLDDFGKYEKVSRQNWMDKMYSLVE